MAAGTARGVIRAPGKLIVAPSQAFDGGAFPYGGTPVGLIRDARLTEFGLPGKEIFDEGSGEVVEVLEPARRWMFTCFLRGWDDDAVAQFFKGNRSQGDVSQHSVFNVPGTRLPGQSTADSLNLVLAFIPDNPIEVDGFMIYRGVPMWTPDAELAFQAGEEFALPLQVLCLRNSANHTVQIGRLPDLPLA